MSVGIATMGMYGASGTGVGGVIDTGSSGIGYGGEMMGQKLPKRLKVIVKRVNTFEDKKLKVSPIKVEL
jgi:hypothetical protein